MEERYTFQEEVVKPEWVEELVSHLRSKTERATSKTEGATATLLIMGHGRERYKEVFARSLSHYGEAFQYKVREQNTRRSVRILSKAGRPKVCAWDYALCAKKQNIDVSSQELLKTLSHVFFDERYQNTDTLTLLQGLSLYWRELYPSILRSVQRNYRSLPEDKHSGSPGAEGYAERYADFQKVLGSVDEGRFSQLKMLSHEKIFTIRGCRHDVHCLEMIDLRIPSPNAYTNLAKIMFPLRENMAQDYRHLSEDRLRVYLDQYVRVMREIHASPLTGEEQARVAHCLFQCYFGEELYLSDLVECLVLLGIETVNIIDNTCRVSDHPRGSKSSARTSSIERREKWRSRSSTRKRRSSSK